MLDPTYSGLSTLGRLDEPPLWLFGSDIDSFIWSWANSKNMLERSIAFSADSLHVIVGAVGLLIAALILRRPVSSTRPWLVILALSLINEFLDLSIERWPDIGMQYGESIRDLLLTMVLPTLLLLSSRYLPRLYLPRSGAGPAASADDERSSTRAPM